MLICYHFALLLLACSHAQAALSVVPLPAQVRLEAPQGMSTDTTRPAELIIRPTSGNSLASIQALAIDPVDAEVSLGRAMPSVSIDPSDSRFRTPFAFRIPSIQNELRIPLTLRPKGREASALEVFFLTFSENGSLQVAFQTLVVLEKTGTSRYEVTPESSYLKRRMEATTHADPLRSTSRKRHDPSIEERRR